MSDIGITSVQHLRQRMQVDAEWSVDRPRGFTWWPHGLAQHVWAEPCIDDGGVTLSRIHVRTDLCSGFSEENAPFRLLGAMMARPSMYGLIRDPLDPSKLQLASSVFVHEQVFPWTMQLILTAAFCQACEAVGLATLDPFEEAGMSPAWGDHPRSGERSTPDELIRTFPQVVQNSVRPLDFSKAIETMLEFLESQGLPCSGEEDHLLAELPFRGMTSLVKFETGKKHDSFGPGMNTLHRFPLPTTGMSPEQEVLLALILNNQELAEPTWSHFLGSWTPGRTGPQFLAYFPDAVANVPGALQNTFMSEAMRSRWISSQDWDGEEENSSNPTDQRQQLVDMDDEHLEAIVRSLHPDMSTEMVQVLIRTLRAGLNQDNEPEPSSEGDNLPEETEPEGAPIEFDCPACGLTLSAPSKSAGETMSCPRCRQRARIPER